MQIFYQVGENSRLFHREKMAIVHGEKKIWGINFKSSVHVE